MSLLAFAGFTFLVFLTGLLVGWAMASPVRRRRRRPVTIDLSDRSSRR